MSKKKSSPKKKSYSVGKNSSEKNGKKTVNIKGGMSKKRWIIILASVIAAIAIAVTVTLILVLGSGSEIDLELAEANLKIFPFN